MAVSKPLLSIHGSKRLICLRNHVIGDLEPFTCVFSHCLEDRHSEHGASPLTFETSKAWSDHMQTAHGHTWECRAPSHNPIVFEQEIQYRRHSIQEHGVPEAHAGTLSNAARRSVLEKVLECPFGDDFQISGKIESSVVFASGELQTHIAGHMKEIALLTLQKLPSDNDENAENIDSDKPLDDDGPDVAVGITRASMDSLLEDEDLHFQDAEAEAENDDVGHHEEEISARVTVLDLEDKNDSGKTKLHHAVQACDLNLVETLLHDSASVNVRDTYGQTPLHFAAGCGSIECIEALVKHGADSHVLDNSGFSAFLWAVVAGQEGATKRLMSMDAGVHSLVADGKSALAWAVTLGRSSISRLLIEHGASMSNTRNTQQQIPLLTEAAASGNLHDLQLLLQCGEDPNHRDRDGWSPIHWAAEEGHLEIVRVLLDAGASVNAVSSYGTSPLHCAANGGHVSIVRLLLLQRADPIKSTCHGWTALHHAAFMGHSHVVRSLLEEDRIRSIASRQDNHGWSVLHLVIQSRDLDTVRALLDNSVITETQSLIDESGLTAVEWLDRGPASRAQKATNDLALSKSRCCRAVTSLRQAVTIGNVPMINLLFKLGYDINGMDSGRRTALYYAAKKGMLPIVDLLLNLGADPNILPLGRKTWEELIPPGPILQRLTRAGYQKQNPDPEVERQIRQCLRVQHQPTVPDRPAWSAADEPTIPMLDPSVSPRPEQPSSPVPAPLIPPAPVRLTSDRSTVSSAPAFPPSDNKRKARSGKWWKRLTGGENNS